MNYDVNDPEKGFRHAVEMKDAEKEFSGKPRPRSFFSRIRNFNLSSLGSAFAGPMSAMSSYITQEDQQDSKELYGGNAWEYANDLEAGYWSYDSLKEGSESHQLEDFSYQELYYDTNDAAETPSQTRSNSPFQVQEAQTGRVSDIKRLFHNLARFRQSDSTAQIPSTAARNFFFSNGHGQWTGPNVSYKQTEASGTPPLTPDSLDDSIPTSTTLGDCDYDDDNDIRIAEEGAMEWARSRSLSNEIKEGKKPDRSLNGADGSMQSQPAVYDDRNEWYGLEYTLELSCRERLPSDTRSAGEHSKSRESWAAIHQGTIHPFLEDEDYYQWKNWHRYLDRQDERKRHKRGLEFKALSKDLAWFYVDEMRTRDLLYWQKEVYGFVARDVKERLTLLAERRPDPYFPPKTHNLGWYLKRSLSVACLHELRPSLCIDRQNTVRYHECNERTGEEFYG